MKKAIISRTIVTNHAFGKVFYSDTNEIRDARFTIPAQYTTSDKAEKYLRKQIIPNGGKLVMISKVEKQEQLVGMYLDEFITAAKQVTERSKDTRGTITKTVEICIGKALYMDEAQTVQEKTVIFPVSVPNVDGYIRKNYTFPGYFITVKDVETIETLYSMDEKTFIALARPMRNKFQLDA